MNWREEDEEEDKRGRWSGMKIFQQRKKWSRKKLARPITQVCVQERSRKCASGRRVFAKWIFYQRTCFTTDLVNPKKRKKKTLSHVELICWGISIIPQSVTVRDCSFWNKRHLELTCNKKKIIMIIKKKILLIRSRERQWKTTWIESKTRKFNRMLRIRLMKNKFFFF